MGLATRKRTDGPYFFASMVKHFKGFPGATLGEKVKNYCLLIGVTEAEIEAIRKNLMNSQN